MFGWKSDNVVLENRKLNFERMRSTDMANRHINVLFDGRLLYRFLNHRYLRTNNRSPAGKTIQIRFDVDMGFRRMRYHWTGGVRDHFDEKVIV